MQFQENIDLVNGAGLPPHVSPLSRGSGKELPVSSAPYMRHYKDLSGRSCSQVLILQEIQQGPHCYELEELVCCFCFAIVLAGWPQACHFPSLVFTCLCKKEAFLWATDLLGVYLGPR